MGRQASSGQPRWPRMLIGGVLLWRTLCAAALIDTGDLLDSRFLGEWSSPGLNRSVKLTFKSYHWEEGVSSGPRASAALDPPSRVSALQPAAPFEE